MLILAMLILVRFVKGPAPYNAGETAGFPEDEAKALVERGVATRLSGAEVKKLRAAKAPSKVATPPELVLVRFLKGGEHDPHPPAPFLPGETAAFNQATAAAFIEAGVAEVADKPETVGPTGALPDPGKPPVKVTFVVSARGYMAGEDATFSEAEANELIKQGLAVLPGDAPKKPEATKAGEGLDVLGKTDREGLEPLGAGSGTK